MDKLPEWRKSVQERGRVAAKLLGEQAMLLLLVSLSAE